MMRKNLIIITGLILLVLLTMASAAAEDISNDTAYETSDTVVADMESPQETELSEVQDEEIELVDENELAAESIGQAEENDFDDESLSQGEIKENLGEYDPESYKYVYDYPIKKKYDTLLHILIFNATNFDDATQVQHDNQLMSGTWFLFIADWNGDPLNLDSHGRPMELRGGATDMGEIISNGGSHIFSVNAEGFYNVYILGNTGNGQHGVFDGKGLSSIARISHTQTGTFFKNADIKNAINGAFIVENFTDKTLWLNKNLTPQLVFENCNFQNISGEVVVANYKCNITFKNCLFEDIRSEYGIIRANHPDVNATFIDCKFNNVTCKADLDTVNSADGVLTVTLKPAYANYMGVIACNGTVVIENCIFWDGTKFIHSNATNIRESTLKNKSVNMRILTGRGYLYNFNFITDENSQFKFDYINSGTDFYTYSEGMNHFELFYDGDNYILPFHLEGDFETKGDFTYLKELVENASANDNRYIYWDLRYSDVYDKSIVNGILIKSSQNGLTIDGNGHTIDARGFTTLFNIEADHVTIRNMTILNAVNSNNGGAINIAGDHCTIENVIFRNNTASNGGAICINGKEVKIINSIFELNNAEEGGAIFIGYTSGNHIISQGTRFINNTAQRGGAIYSYNSPSIKVEDAEFKDNHASLGGAIYNVLKSIHISSSNFTANNATEKGGAIYTDVGAVYIVNSNFLANSADEGGAINSHQSPLFINSTLFKENKANATEIVVVEDDRVSQILTVGLKVKQNYINAIYAEDDVSLSFNNVSYWGEDEWEVTSSAVKTDYAPFVKIHLYALSFKNYVFTDDAVSDENGMAVFIYDDAPTGYYALVNLQHEEDSMYPTVRKMTSISVKNATFDFLQNLIDKTPEGEELVLTKDFVYSESDTITDGIKINKNITINGNGHIIDANGQTRIFNINASEVNIKGITFENAKNVPGSVAYIAKGDVKINQCIFLNNPGPVISGEISPEQCDLNNNWFGNDWTNYNVKSSLLGDFNPETWYFLNVIIDINNLSISLNNLYNSSDDSIIDGEEECELPLVNFTYNASHMKINAPALNETINVFPDNNLSYVAGDNGYYYDGPLGITLSFGGMSFTQEKQFYPEIHLEGLPDEIEYGNVSQYIVRVIGTFGEVLTADKYKTILFNLDNNKYQLLSDTEDGYTLLHLNTTLQANEVRTYSYNLTFLNLEDEYPVGYGKFTIVGIDTSLNINPIDDFHVEDEQNLTIVLGQKYGNVPEGILTVTINDVASAIPVNGERVFTIDLSNYLIGDYDVTVTYEDSNSHFKNNSDSISFKILPYESKVYLDVPDNITYGEDLAFMVYIENKTTAGYYIVNSRNETVKEGEIEDEEIVVSGLAAGDYTLTVVNQYNGTIAESTACKNFTVNKITPNMNVNYIIDGNKAYITATLDSNATGGILFNNVYIHIENGIAMYAAEYENGYHTVNLTYQTDLPEVFNEVNKSVSFYMAGSNITKENTSIEIIPQIVGNYIAMTIKVNPEATGFILIDLDGTPIYKHIENGQVDYFNLLEEGTYNALVAYLGDERFNANSTNLTFDIKDPELKNTSISAEVNVNGGNVEITAEVDEDATGYVAFTINGTTYNIDVFYGKAVFNGFFPEGNYEMQVEYLGDDWFNGNSTSVNFTINKPELENTTIDIISNITDDELALILHLDSRTNGFVSIEIDDEVEYVKVNNGLATYKTKLVSGNYTAIIKYLGDDIFNPAEANLNVSIPEIVLKDPEFELLTEVSDNMLKVNFNINSDATGFIQLSINGTVVTLGISDDPDFIGYYAYLTNGTYNISATYSGDKYFNYSTVEKIVEIVPTENTTVSASASVDGKSVTVTAEVGPRATGFVEFEIAGKKYYAPIIDSKATFSNTYDVGSYSVKVTYLGDETFNPADTTCQFIITEDVPELKNTTIDADIEVDGNGVIINARVNETANGLIAFDIDGHMLYIPITNGEAVASFALPIGNYDVQVTYTGDSQFNPAQLNKSFEVTEDTKFETLVEFVFNKNATGTIVATVNGVNYTAELVDGVATMNITNLNMSGDEIKFNFDNVNINELIKVLVDGVEYEVPLTNGTASIETNRMATVIEYKDMVTKTIDTKIDGRNGKYFTFTLKDANGKPMANTPMKIGFNGVIYDEKNGIVTDENGTAKLQINLGYKGVYTFAICYLGDEKYNASFAVAKITVNLQTPTLTVPNKSYKAAAKSKVLTATLKDSYGKLVPNKKVTFTVNGKTYKATTNAKGVASVKVSLSAKKTYKFTVKLAESSVYSAVTKTAKVVIK